MYTMENISNVGVVLGAKRHLVPGIRNPDGGYPRDIRNVTDMIGKLRK